MFPPLPKVTPLDYPGDLHPNDTFSEAPRPQDAGSSPVHSSMAATAVFRILITTDQNSVFIPVVVCLICIVLFNQTAGSTRERDCVLCYPARCPESPVPGSQHMLDPQQIPSGRLMHSQEAGVVCMFSECRESGG